MSIYPCSVCNASIEMHPCHRRKSQHVFCSDKCRKTPFIHKACKTCGKEFVVSAQDATKYCSKECRLLHLRQIHAKGQFPKVEKICAQCHQKYTVRKTMADKQIYCSKKCFYATRTLAKSGKDNHKWKEKVKMTCDECGNNFETYPSRAGRRRYCSKECGTRGNLKRLAAGQRTSIEKAMAAELKKHHIEFDEQVPLFNKFMVDFLLKHHPIVIQCDGAYWHDRESVKGRDKGQDTYLTNAGYTVLRFSDKQINKSIHECIRQIKAAIKNPNQIPLFTKH